MTTISVIMSLGDIMLNIEKGTVLGNIRDLYNATGCWAASGIAIKNELKRRVLVTSQGDTPYKDTESGNTHFYRGEGQVGDQSIYAGKNQTLYRALTDVNGYEVYLVRKDERLIYTFLGEVRFADGYQDIYYENENDIEGKIRKVIIFPISVVDTIEIACDESSNIFAVIENDAEYNPNAVLKEDLDKSVRPKKRMKEKGKVISHEQLEKQLETKKKIGKHAEVLVCAYEKDKLINLGHPELADKVHIVSDDGLGYDVKSYLETGEPLHIEVKGTTLGKFAPFYISSNELRLAHNLENYRLYRVYNLNSNPQFCSYTQHEFYEIFITDPQIYVCNMRIQEEYDNHSIS